ncbi:MAG: zinc-binding dehydrogenase, partial [Actinobacteria bacterium]|nr:zinc-binding dehydrogenase [Actinomycetota bacterium]
SMPFVDLPDGPGAIGSRRDLPGALGEFMVLDAKRLLAVPDGLSIEHASLAEPLAVGVRAVRTAGRGGGEGPFLVVGCGPIGLAVIAALRAGGKGPIIASDFSETRRKIAEVLGADVVVDPAQRSPFETFAGLGYEPSPASTFLPAGMEPKRATIFECVGAPGVLQSILAGAPRHSHIVVAGLCFGEDRFQPSIASTNELLLDFVMCYRPEEFELSLRSIADGKVDVSPIVTDVVGLDRTAWAFDALAEGTHAKVVIRATD